MKKFIVLAFLLLGAVSSAQIKSLDSTYIEGLKTDLAGTYTEIIKKNLELTDEQAKVFWPLFDKYLAASKENIDKRVALTEEYMMNFYSLDEKTAKKLMNSSFDLEQKILNLKKDYMKKMLNKLPATLVGKFFQIDARVSAVIHTVRMTSTPLIRQNGQ